MVKDSFLDRLIQRWMETPVAGRLVSPKIKRILSILHPSQDPEEICRSYYREKMLLMIRIGMVAGVFMLLILISDYLSSLKHHENVLLRGEESQLIALEVQTDRSDKTSITYELNPKSYTRAQIREYVSRFQMQGESLILGENEDLQHVHTNLCLQEFYKDYPMQFSWESSDYRRIAQDGSVENENLKNPETILLTVQMSYDQQMYEESFTVRVVPKKLTDSQQKEKEILAALRKADEEQKYTEQLRLPEKLLGESVEYSIAGDSAPIMLFVFMPVLLVAVYGAKDRDLEKELERRKKRLGYRYPEFVSKVRLLLGAGISMRNVFIRLSEDASLGEELQGELKTVVRDMKNGMSLRDALDRFGKRTANPFYIKFSALMIQNMKKGTEDLFFRLSGEMSEAFTLRKMQARQLGEEAGTKLLLPMVLMLVVVMATLMIPAFLSFQL